MMKIAFAVATGATAAQSRARSAVAIKRFAQVSSKLTAWAAQTFVAENRLTGGTRSWRQPVWPLRKA